MEEIERKNAMEIQTTGNTFAGGVHSGRFLCSFILISVINFGRDASRMENVLDLNARKAKKKNKKTFRIFVIVAFPKPSPVTAVNATSVANKTNPIIHASVAIEKIYFPMSSIETGP